MIERSDRLHPSQSNDLDGRSAFVLDRDLVFHSSAFRRLGQITQVMAPNEEYLFQNRRSHSLEVARIGRALAAALLARPDGQQKAREAGGIEPAVVEAAALAHDLGHPPFGHDAEDELDQLLTAAGVTDGFEANAQSFRVVCTLAGASASETGMNLTRATLAAILKYPWRRDESPDYPAKWGAYAAESAELCWARALMPAGSQEPTLEARLMDWADLVAYSAFDCEDFIRSDLIPIARLTRDPAERERFLDLVSMRRRIPRSKHGDLAATFERLLTACPVPRVSTATRSGRAALRCFTDHEVNDAVSSVSLVDGDRGVELAIEPATQCAILLLEGLTWHYVIDSGLLATQRQQQRQVIQGLFEELAQAAVGTRDDSLFSPAVRERLRAAEDDSARLRMVGDFIASMTEGQALDLFQRVRERPSNSFLVNPA